VYRKVSVGLKCVRASRVDSFLNLSPSYTHVSRKVISVSEISAVNFLDVFSSFFMFVYIDSRFKDRVMCLIHTIIVSFSSLLLHCSSCLILWSLFYSALLTCGEI